MQWLNLATGDFHLLGKRVLSDGGFDISRHRKSTVDPPTSRSPLPPRGALLGIIRFFFHVRI